RNRGIVDRRYADSDGAGSSAAIAIADGDHKGITAVVVRIGRVSELARRRVEAQAAIGRLTGQGVTEAVAIGVGGHYLAANGRVFVGDQVEISGHRRVIER